MIPTTFKEQLRAFYSYLLAAAGVAIGVGVGAIVAILTWGGWPSTFYGKIIDYLGWLALGGGGIMAVIIAFLGLGGPAKAFKATFKDASIETEGDPDCE